MEEEIERLRNELAIANDLIITLCDIALMRGEE